MKWRTGELEKKEEKERKKGRREKKKEERKRAGGRCGQRFVAAGSRTAVHSEFVLLIGFEFFFLLLFIFGILCLDDIEIGIAGLVN